MGEQPLILALAMLLVATGAARAAEPPRDAVELTFQDCDSEPIGESSFRKLLGLELDQDLDTNSPHAGNEGSAAKIEVKFGCDGLASIRIQLENINTQRRVRFGDVAKSERARALALVVAELVRGGSQSSQLPAEETVGSFPDARDAEPAPHPAQASSPAQAGTTKARAARSSARVPPGNATRATTDTGVSRSTQKPPADASRLRIRGAVALRTSLGGEGTLYGGSLGLDLHVLRVAAEALFSRETRPRGAISSGLAAVRIVRAAKLLENSGFELHGLLSASAGATWAVGHSEIVGSVVRNVLMPYGDARLGLLSAVHLNSELDLELELHAGRAAGILARADGEPVLATGGWFVGAETGLSF